MHLKSLMWVIGGGTGARVCNFRLQNTFVFPGKYSIPWVPEVFFLCAAAQEKPLAPRIIIRSNNLLYSVGKSLQKRQLFRVTRHARNA